MKKNLLCAIFMSIIHLPSASAGVDNFTEKKLFTIEKSFKSENILIISSMVDDQCKFVSRNDSFYDFYWMINREKRQPVHHLIKSNVASRVSFIGANADKDMFRIRLNDLKEINHDLENNIIEVRAEIINGKCSVKSIIKLGASAQYKDLSLDRTFCEVKTNMVGVPNGCSQLELKGKDLNNDSSNLKVTFKGK